MAASGGDTAFLEGFCKPNMTLADFSNELGAFTPCFIDLAVLGTAEAFAILVCALLLLRTWGRPVLGSTACRRYRLAGAARAVQAVQVAAAVAAALVPLLQLSARLGAAAATGDGGGGGGGVRYDWGFGSGSGTGFWSGFGSGRLWGGERGDGAVQPLAPYEWTGFGLSEARWLALIALLLRELQSPGHVILPGRWVLRLALAVGAASEAVKARFVFLGDPTHPPHGYLSYLYGAYLVLQLALALPALTYRPRRGVGLVPAEGQEDEDYLPLTGSAEAAAAPHPPCPEPAAGLISYFTFGWVGPLIKKGYASSLAAGDIWSLPPGDGVEGLSADFERMWRAELASRGPARARLGLVCWRLTARLFLGAVPYKAANDAAQFAGPLFLNMLLQALASGAPPWRGYAACGLLFAALSAGALADGQHFQRVMRAGYRLRAALALAVQAQVFRLTPASRAGLSSGRLYSLVASDAEALQALCQNAMGLMSSPLRIAVALFLLYQQLGPSAVVAVAVLVALVPANSVLVTASNRQLKAALSHTDERTKLEAEMVAGMEVVKCSGWEEPLQERVEAARRQELGRLWGVSLLSSLVTLLLLGAPVVIPLLSFGAYLALGNSLDAPKAFTCLVLFNILRFPLFQLPMLVAQLSAARVSLGRLSEALAADAADPAPPLPAAERGETAVRLTGDWGWDPKLPPCLVDLDLDLKAGQLVAVVGATGSGKSTLLSCLLGAAQQVFGPKPLVRGRLAYVPQAPFIVSGTVRDNILFGLPMDPPRYAQALRGSCLEEDLRRLAGGDAAELGDRGVTLSGGQKQRLALARCLYAAPDVALLDDPLSALDAAVGRRVLEGGIRGTLLSGPRPCLVVLATNALAAARGADWVVLLAGGRVAEAGRPGELAAREGGAFAAILREQGPGEEHSEGEGEGGSPKEAGEGAAAGNGKGEAKGEAAVKGKADGGGGAAEGAAEGDAPPQAAAVRLTADESTSAEEGAAGAALGAYLAAMPHPLAPLGALLGPCGGGGKGSGGGGGGGRGRALEAGVWIAWGLVAAEALRVATTVWLAQWTGSTDASSPGGRSPMWYLGVYAAISGVQLAVQAGTTLDISRMGLGAARHLHARLLSSLLSARMAFFHATPLGRVVNRLTRDTADIDRNLASALAMAARSFLTLLSTMVLVGAVAPFALPALVVILAGFYWLYAYFQASVRQLKRLDAASRSPVLSALGEALAGTATYTAYGAQPRALARSARLLDSLSALALASQSMNRWLSVRLEVLGAAAALLAGAVAVEQRASAGAAGLVMSYALQITTAVSITVRAASMAENMLNAVERVVEYSSLPPEEQPPPPGAPPRLPPPPGWPQEGAVEFRGVWLRYRPGLPLVLRGVSFRAEARDKIGVVGRTGAGKSSLLGCLFRLVEAERGSILIDELDIGRMALRELRPRLSLIPQVPVLFAGSIRTNLSPFGAHSDAALWAALRRAHLAPTVEAWPAGLDTELTEGGAPLSAGQRQLMALARALLSPARVLVLDEATANVDLQTDALIQSTLRSEFPDRTLLAIAHRLATVIDYTRILVLEAGQVVEYDSPSALLAAPRSAFGRLVDATGEASARQLRALAAGGGGGVQALLEAPAKAALARLASNGRAPPPGPGLSRINSTGHGRGGSPPSPTHGGPLPPTRSGGSGFGAGLTRLLSRSRGGGAMASAGGLSQPLLEEGEGEGGSCPWGGAGMSFGGGGMGTGEEWDAGVPLPLPALAAAVAGRSCAVARMVQELRREMDRAAEAEAAAAARGPGGGGGGTVGAAVDDLAMVMGAAGGGGGGVGGGSDDEGGGGGGRGGGGGSAAAADVASLAAARAALGRCVALLDEARAGAVAMKRAWAAGAWGGGGAAAAPPPPLLAPVASGGPAAGAPGAEAPDASA